MYWNNNHINSQVNLKLRDKLGGQRTGTRYHSVSIGNQSIHLMNEKVVSANWIDRDRGILEIIYDPNEDGKYVRAMHLGPDEYVTLPSGMTAQQAASMTNYQHTINRGMQSRGNSSCRQEREKPEKPAKSKKKGFFGLERWSIANILVSIVMIPLWLIWKIFVLGLIIQIFSSEKD